MEMENPDIIYGLRHLKKGRPGDTFKMLFKKLENLVSSATAADDRRHGIAHMTEFISIRDLLNKSRQIFQTEHQYHLKLT